LAPLQRVSNTDAAVVAVPLNPVVERRQLD
jgi:hypothetical protein